MDENEVVWPWGMDEGDPDPASRPWVFDPHGFVLAVAADDDEAEMAKGSLAEAGFGPRELRVFSGRQVLQDRERFLTEQRSLRRLVGRLTSDSEAVQLFLDYAHAGRSFLWVHVPDKKDANRAVRGLSGHRILHLRYYGDDSVEDIHVG